MELRKEVADLKTGILNDPNYPDWFYGDNINEKTLFSYLKGNSSEKITRYLFRRFKDSRRIFLEMVNEQSPFFIPEVLGALSGKLEIDKAEKDITELRSVISNLNSNLSAIKENHDILEEDVSKLENERDTIGMEVNEMKQERENLLASTSIAVIKDMIEISDKIFKEAEDQINHPTGIFRPSWDTGNLSVTSRLLKDYRDGITKIKNIMDSEGFVIKESDLNNINMEMDKTYNQLLSEINYATEHNPGKMHKWIIEELNSNMFAMQNDTRLRSIVDSLMKIRKKLSNWDMEMEEKLNIKIDEKIMEAVK